MHHISVPFTESSCFLLSPTLGSSRERSPHGNQISPSVVWNKHGRGVNPSGSTQLPGALPVKIAQFMGLRHNSRLQASTIVDCGPTQSVA